MLHIAGFPRRAGAAGPFVGRAGIGGPNAPKARLGKRMRKAFTYASEDLMRRFWSGTMTAEQCLRLVLSRYPQLWALLKNNPVWNRVLPGALSPTR